MLRSIIRSVAVLAVLAVFLVALPLRAQDLPQPEGVVILTVTGAVQATNAEGSARFDLAMLEEMGATTFTTSTIWTEGPQQFEGVSLKVLTQRLGIASGMLRATAINDYTVEIPFSDAVEGGAIIAYKVDGKTMSLREKGPLWIVYPYDSSADFQTEVIYSRSIWQLDRIEAVK